MTVGERVNDLRRRRGWSQRDLANASGIHFTHVTRLERDEREPKLTMLMRLAQGFGVTLSELLEGVDEIETLRRMPAQTGGGRT